MRLVIILAGVVLVAISMLSASVHAAGCSEIRLNTGTVSVERGGTGFATFFLENGADEDFLVDFVNAFDSSGNLEAGSNGYAKVVPSFGDAFVNVVVKAHEFAAVGEDEAFIEVRGHFQGGRNCYAFGREIAPFPVIILEKEPVGAVAEKAGFSGQCNYFSITVPSSQVINGKGSVPITIDNRTMERATVSLSGPGLAVEPKLISVPRNTAVSEKVAVSSVLSETSLVYSIDALGCRETKSTRILSMAKQPAQQAAGSAAGSTIGGLGAGFVAMGQAGAILGLIALVAAVAYLVLKP